jgi:transcriptional regulator with XRE-family HTH domain
MSVDYRLIGTRIKEKRKEAGKTQEQLAENLSVTVGYVSQLERGITKISLDTLSNICAALNCDMEYFVSGVTMENKEYMKDELYYKAQLLNKTQRQMLLEIIDIIKKY